ncbi:hypothetical protein [Spirochaeta africana]|uniref:Uncharacterized protein n=1 Tax=Spirochaeta africana (strain ATCC 700263 / DSM 8902 / Z-7692) TaxID=889378 RepID=H9UJ38_SPIAZ|nr:hypothetical protein [Spirochaeta africana]AFG37531.1 hypothetical protein Spiaf_1469 [Spirochaeta africana DSM 8902]
MRLLLLTTHAHHLAYCAGLGLDRGQIIHYEHAVKAMDNLSEIQPDVVVVSAHDFPRHWKALYMILREQTPDALFYLILDAPLHVTEKRKAESMSIDGYLTPGECPGFVSAEADLRNTIRQFIAGQSAGAASDTAQTTGTEYPAIAELPPGIELIPCRLRYTSADQAELYPDPVREITCRPGSHLYITAAGTAGTMAAAVIRQSDQGLVSLQLLTPDLHANPV